MKTRQFIILCLLIVCGFVILGVMIDKNTDLINSNIDHKYKLLYDRLYNEIRDAQKGIDRIEKKMSI